MIRKIAKLNINAQRRILETVLSARGDMPEVTKYMPKSGVPFNYSCWSFGPKGWYSDKDGGYRYVTRHPVTGEEWPAIPQDLTTLINKAIQLVENEDPTVRGFDPDSVLCNKYEPGQTLGVHIDRTEKNRVAPILSLSLGCSADFVYGPSRSCGNKIRLESGDVFIMSGPHRNWWHGIPKVYADHNELGLDYRLNLTIRQDSF